MIEDNVPTPVSENTTAKPRTANRPNDKRPHDKRDVAEVFRERMGLLIDQRRESLAAFARAIGLDRSALSQFLAPGSTRLPRAETLHAIAARCGVSLDWLLGLIATDDAQGETAPLLELVETDHRIDGQLLADWHREATGYKIRYVPSTLPDLLRTEAVSQHEFGGYERDQLQAKEEAIREQLDYSRRPETDMEVCVPWQRFTAFARGDDPWNDLNRETRLEQLRYMADLTEEMYPTFRLFLYDGKAVSASPYTVFGPKRAAIYLGQMYLVVNSAEHIKALTRHFDNLIRIAKIGPDKAAGHIRQLEQDLRNGRI